MLQRKKVFTTLAAATAALALVAGCSGGSGGGGDNSNQSSVAPPPNSSGNSENAVSPASRDAVKDGGKLTWVLSQTIPNFNYWELDGTLLDTANILGALLPSEYHFDAEGNPSVNTDYFTKIEQTSTSPQTITYTINPKAKWSDGTAISWEDFAGLAKANSGKADGYTISSSTGYSQISSVTKGVNDQQAVVKFSTPFADWKGLFAPLVPASLTASATVFNKSWVSKPLVTAGPFKWGSEDKTAQSYTVVRDDNWWGNKAKLDSITFQAYSDTAAAVQAMGSKQVQYVDISGGSAYQNIQALKKYNYVKIQQAGGSNYRQITVNAKDSILSDLKVRQALSLGIDRNRVAKLLIGNLGGNPTALDNHIFLKNNATYKATCSDLCTYNPTKAKQLLESDGWKLNGQYYAKNGKSLSLTITIPADTPNATQESETAQATLKAVGIELKIQAVPTNDFFEKYINVGKFQLTVFTWIGGQFPVSGAVSIYSLDPKNVGQNFGFGGNTQINDLLTKANSSLDASSENDLANQADAAIWQNASWLPLYQRPEIVGVDSTVVNLGAAGFADVKYEDIGYKK